MLGSLAAFGLYATFGLTPETSTFGIVIDLAAILVLAMLTSGSLNVMIERVAYRPLAGAPKLAPLICDRGVVHPPERRHPLDRRFAERADLIARRRRSSTSSGCRSRAATSWRWP